MGLDSINISTEDLMDIIEEYELDKLEANPCPLKAFCIYIMFKYQKHAILEKSMQVDK